MAFGRPRSHTPNPTTPRTANPAAGTTSAEPDPDPSIRANDAPPSTTTLSAAPNQSSGSSFAAGSCVSGTQRDVTSAARPMGTLTTNAHRQDTSTSRPPTSGPIAPATPPSPDHAPTARPRSSGRSVASMIARLPGVSSAAPTPWSSRPAISQPAEGAHAHSSDATANHATPTRNTRTRPHRSPNEPPMSTIDARVTR